MTGFLRVENIHTMKLNDPLDSLLGSWRVDLPKGQDFHDSVWNRIASQAEEDEAVIPMRSGLRPAVMASAAAVILGFSLGFLTPGGSSDAAKDEYFARINPLSGV